MKVYTAGTTAHCFVFSVCIGTFSCTVHTPFIFTMLADTEMFIIVAATSSQLIKNPSAQKLGG